MKKRIIAFLLLILMTVNFVPASTIKVFAAEEFTIFVSQAKVKQGTDTVTIDVMMKNNPGMAGVTLVLEFDNSALKVKSVTAGDFSSLTLVPGQGTESPYKAMLANFTGGNVTGDGKLMSVTFDILDSTQTGTYGVTLKSNSKEEKLFVVDESGAHIDHVSASGSVTVESGKPVGGGHFDEQTPDNEKEEMEDKGQLEEESEISKEKWINPFTDVKEEDWFSPYVEYVVTKGLFKGVSDSEFAPSATLTRAMLVTVLYRAEGEPEASESADFSDVTKSAYYAKAVDWAKNNGIVNGVTETQFAPDLSITREQIAAIMFRYAVFKGMTAVTLEENLGFDDADQISEYAISALNWAVGQGLIKGRTETTLNPKDTATRAEAATILTRFFSEIEK